MEAKSRLALTDQVSVLGALILIDLPLHVLFPPSKLFSLRNNTTKYNKDRQQPIIFCTSISAEALVIISESPQHFRKDTIFGLIPQICTALLTFLSSVIWRFKRTSTATRYGKVSPPDLSTEHVPLDIPWIHRSYMMSWRETSLRIHRFYMAQANEFSTRGMWKFRQTPDSLRC